MVNEVIKTDFSFKETVMLINIWNTNVKKTTLSSLLKQIDGGTTNPIFWRVCGHLKDYDIMKEVERYGNTSVMTINYKKLLNLIKEQEVVEFFYDKLFSYLHVF